MTNNQGPRAYPVLGLACIVVGTAFLAVSAFGNWRFGWSLAHQLIDRYWLAIIYGGSDVAAGVMVAAGATMLHHKGFWWRIGGLSALLPALILVTLSVLSTFGMMSGRIATQVGHSAAMKMDADRLAWLRGTAMNREMPKADRRLFRLEERQAAAEARKQAAVVTDSQAVAILNAAHMVGFSATLEQVQVGLTFVTSTMPMTIKFVLLWIGFFLFGVRLPTETAAVNHGSRGSVGGSGGGGGSVEPPRPKLVHPEPPSKIKAEPPTKVRRTGQRVSPSAPSNLSAFDRAYEAAMAHPHLSTRALAAVAGVSQMTSQRVKKRVRSKADTIMRKHGNGGGYRPAYN